MRIYIFLTRHGVSGLKIYINYIALKSPEIKNFVIVKTALPHSISWALLLPVAVFYLLREDLKNAATVENEKINDI